jgi:UMP-CMP kinase
MRGGSRSKNRLLFSTSAPAVMKEESSYFKQRANDSLAIAGPSTMKYFGGLKFRDLQDGMQKVVFVLGGPGAGKGTQSELLLQNYPCVHLSAGQLLREETAKAESPHAALIEECLVAGKIVPVEISLALLQNAMQEAPGKSLVFLVDGFPRNFDNLEGWTHCMKEVAMVWGALVYQCPLPILEQRILERAKASGRSDDNLESIRKRFTTFEDETVPIIDTLRLVGVETFLQVFDVRGDQPLERVWQDTQDIMNSIVGDDVIAANSKLLKAVATGDLNLYRSLCAEEMFATNSPSEVMIVQEGNGDFPEVNVSNAEVNFISGTRISLTYDRVSKTATFKETRVWSHQGLGWKMVHFSRSPIST